MSTRTNVLIKQTNGAIKCFYHHHDGYLQGVGFELANMCYLAETMTGYKIDFEKREKLFNTRELNNNFMSLINRINSYEFWGFTDEVAGDIEYLYLIEITEREGLKLSYIETPCGSDRKEFVKEILSGKGKELALKIAA